MTAPLKVYVAASSAEIERAKRCVEMILHRGTNVLVVSTWIENVEKVGTANPRDAEVLARARWASKCAEEVKNADLFWLLAPTETPGRGAYFELGVSMAVSSIHFQVHGVHRWAISSGDTKQSIFTALTREFALDTEAAVFIRQLARDSKKDHRRG